MAETIPLYAGRAPGALGDAPEDRPTLTWFPAAGAGPHACVVVCPGGGYAMRADHEGEPIARWLNTLGVAAAVLAYRVAPYRHPVPLWDAQRAIRAVRARAGAWKLDAKRIGILGFSAGGHLAASASTLSTAGDAAATDPVERESSRPDAAILCYPVITFGEHRHDGSLRNLLGQEPDPAMQRALSLETRVTAATPPTFLWHTSDEDPVPVFNSLLYATALRTHRVPFALHVFPRGPHGLGLAQGDATVGQWTTLAARWLTEIGFR
ncbi:MAG TPA: alpha/beta hydrolase [Planctomycetota bacterium]|nr:alpha/beta hydrolase [Planctomycetota bacterium]